MNIKDDLLKKKYKAINETSNMWEFLFLNLKMTSSFRRGGEGGEQNTVFDRETEGQ